MPQPQLTKGERVALGEPHNQQGEVAGVTTGPLDDTFVYFATVNGQTEISGPYLEVVPE